MSANERLGLGVKRVLLLIPSTSYRAGRYLEAARRLGVEIVVGSDRRQATESFAAGRSVTLEFVPIGEGVARILELALRHPFDAIIGIDDETTVLAAVASRALRLSHNDPASVKLTRDKFRFRQALKRAGMRSPWFRRISLDDERASLARSLPYPCVIKPLNLSASRGVIRADDEADFLRGCERIERIVRSVEGAGGVHGMDAILVEGFVPGDEFAVEGLLERGRFRPLALFDKPDPLDGPYFEETLYVTPSRLAEERQREIEAEVARASRAVGLREGPVHAEVRINERGVWMVELASRSIGGECSRVLRFAANATLEELILRNALGESSDGLALRRQAAGVMMIPILHAGRLRGVRGLGAARSLPMIDDVLVSVPIDDWVFPLPEGDRYLGFIFASGCSPGDVERALRAAHAQLEFDIVSEATRSDAVAV